MSKNIILLLIMFSFIPINAQSQYETKTYTTKLASHSATYNGSDNPNECYESVSWGILIVDDKNTYFFELPYRALEELKKQIGEAEVLIEVRFFEEPDRDSGADGNVIRVTFNGQVVFGQS